MTSSGPTLPQDTEAEFLRQLGADYADQGFTFIIHPKPDELPDFLGSYRPDAVARKVGANIAFEVKRHLGPGTARSIQGIRRLFDGRSDWRFVIAYMGDDPLTKPTVPRPRPADIASRISEATTLASQGHRNAAFMLAWSLLEAVAHLVDESSQSLRTPGTTLQTLATLGYVEPEAERHLRGLIGLRNKVMHGDLSVEPTEEEINLLLTVISEILLEYEADTNSG